MTDAPSASSPGSTRRLLVVCLVVCLAAWIGLAFARVGGTPFVSEDWTQIAENGAIPELLDAVSFAREPLRPFQHAFLWCVAHCGLDPAGDALPWIAHALGFALHVLSCVLVFRLARLFGLRDTWAWGAALLFAAYPNVKSLAWTAAVGNPARVCFELAAFVAFVAHLRRPSWRGPAGYAAFLAALTCHESAMLFPALLCAWLVLVEAGSLRAGFARVGRALRDPWFLLLVATCALYVAHLATRTQRHHRVKSFDALPANVVKAATALLPEFARTWIVDGFRGQGMPFALAGIAFALLAIAAAVIVFRSRRARFVLAVVACELGLAVLGAGFAQRYAYLSSAFVALGLVAWAARGRGLGAPAADETVAAGTNPTAARGAGARLAAVSLLGAVWAYDAWVDARDFRAVRGLRDTLFERVVAAQGPGHATVVVLDPPDMIGAERDVPLFNWGLDYQLHAHGIGERVILWRTRPYATSSSVEAVDPDRLEATRRAGVPPVVDAADLRQP